MYGRAKVCASRFRRQGARQRRARPRDEVRVERPIRAGRAPIIQAPTVRSVGNWITGTSRASADAMKVTARSSSHLHKDLRARPAGSLESGVGFLCAARGVLPGGPAVHSWVSARHTSVGPRAPLLSGGRRWSLAAYAPGLEIRHRRSDPAWTDNVDEDAIPVQQSPANGPP